jgi:SAM-dependent methyltransferase
MSQHGHDLPNPLHLLDEFRAFQRSLALRTALELDLFTRVGSGAHTIPSLAAQSGASERGLRILCDYLVVQGHLSKQDDRYSLPLHARLYLSTASPAYMGSAVRFLASDAMVQAFCELRQATERHDECAVPALRADESDWVAFAQAMAPLAREIAPLAAAVLSPDFAGPLRVLDIAAGHGVYGLALTARNPSAHIFALDHPKVLAVAAENARLQGVSERYHLLPGDAFRLDFAGPYDLVLMANFAHHFDAVTNIGLFQKCRAALRPSGRLALIDFIANDDRISPPDDAAFALTMLATTARGDVYTFREYRSMLESAGFRQVWQPAGAYDAADIGRWIIVASA